jgi:hypothetical protein
MARYMIETRHTPEECLAALESFRQAGAHFLTHAEWGCDGDVHVGWMILEATNDDEIQRMVPPIIRNKTEPVRLRTYSAEEIRHMHEGH